MAKIIADRVLETSTTTGTGAYALAGAVTGYRAAAAVCANGDTFDYYAEAVSDSGVPTGDWETGLGTWGTGGTLTRTTIHASSNAGAAVNWAAGSKRIALSLTAATLGGKLELGGTYAAGVANAVLYLNALKELGYNAALTFDGANLVIAGLVRSTNLELTGGNINAINNQELIYNATYDRHTWKYNGAELMRLTSGGGIRFPAGTGNIMFQALAGNGNHGFDMFNGSYAGLSLRWWGSSGTGYSQTLGDGVATGGWVFTNDSTAQVPLIVRHQVAGWTANMFEWQNPSGVVYGAIDKNGNIVPGPGYDNTLNLGSGPLRMATLYAGTGTINTSDGREKTAVRPLTAAEINAAKALASEIGVYQFLAAIQAKGDAARQHIGMTVQRAIEVMQGFGLDPFGYGFICHDVWADTFEQVQTNAGVKVAKVRLAERQKTAPRQVVQGRVEVRDGVAVQSTETVTVMEPVFAHLPVVDTSGAPVMVEDRPATPAVLDNDGNVVAPAQEAVYRQLTHAVPVMEAVEETYEDDAEPLFEQRLVRPAGDRYSFRPDELLLFMARGFEARLSALEVPA